MTTYIKSITRRGYSHQSCQDATFAFQNEEYIFAAAFDGCSEVIDSHFASNLLKKAFKREVELQIELEKNHLQNCSPEDIEDHKGIENIAIEILTNFFKKLDLIRIELNLTVNDLSSTCVLFFYDKILQEGIIYVFGDGYIKIDDKYFIIDQENKPKYLPVYWKQIAYGESTLREFLKEYNQIWKIGEFSNVIISTDGLLTLKHPIEEQFIGISRFTENIEVNEKKRIHFETFFEKIYNSLTNEGWIHNDDLGLVRIYNDNE